MKVVFFQPNFRAAGVEKVNILLANEMFKLGVDVEFLVFKKEGEFLNLLNKKIKVTDLSVERALHSFIALVRYFFRHKVIFVSSYSGLSLLSIIANAITLNRSEVYACEHSTLSKITQVKGSFKDKVIKILLKFFYNHCSGVICVSKGVANDLVEHVGVSSKKVKVLYNPVVNNTIFESINYFPEHKWFLDKASPVFIAVGRLDVAKNFALLINAFNKVVEEQDARLLILGEGSLRDELQTQINTLGLQEKCELVGFVDNPYKYMKHADAFVLSSDFEGFGNVIVEAMAVNTPVVSTNCPSGPSEILEDGKWGTLVPVGDVDALANAMLDVINNPPSVDLTVRANHFTTEKAAANYLDYFAGKNKSA